MASPDVLELDKLLAPIPGDNPAGTDLRTDVSPTSDYFRLKDVRAKARASERRLLSARGEDEVGSEAPPDWRPILDSGQKLLAEKTKDLEVAAWLTEALVREHGYAGLRDAFRLLHGLIANFWDSFYPREDEDGMIGRVAPIAGLNGEEADGVLVQPIQMIPITDAPDSQLSIWHYKQAERLDATKDEEARAVLISGGAVPRAEFEAAVKATPPLFFAQLLEDLDACKQVLDQLGNVLQERCGKDAPPTGKLREVVDESLRMVRFVAKDVNLPGAGEAAADAAAAGGAGGAAAGRSGDAPGGRDDAFRQLLKIAEFFRRTEPHSPVSYTLEDLVRRGRLTLPELLGELLQDANAQREFLVTAGIRPPKPPEG